YAVRRVERRTEGDERQRVAAPAVGEPVHLAARNYRHVSGLQRDASTAELERPTTREHDDGELVCLVAVRRLPASHLDQMIARAPRPPDLVDADVLPRRQRMGGE